MAFEMLVGLEVSDEAAYGRYREKMGPLLAAHGGEFGYDFRIAEVLKSPADHPVNRLFTIRFPDQAARDRFFADEQYQAVKRAHFDGAVSGRTLIGAWEV